MIKYSYHLHPEADKDLADSYAWYEDKQQDLGKKFLDAVNKKLGSIVQNPQWYGSKKKGYHETRISKSFPFSIVYKVYPRKKEIIIFSIFHDKRNPRKKYRR